MTISLVAWWSVATVAVPFGAALAGLAIAVRRRSRIALVRVAVWSLLATAGLALAVHSTGLVPLDVPRWFYLVAVLPFVGPAVVVVGGRTLRGGARTLAMACLPLGLVVGVLVVNQHYQYWPTVGALLGRDHVDPLVPETALAGTTPASGQKPAGAAQGSLVDVAIPGTASGFRARSARVWLPPGFRSDPHRPRTVVELIGGTPGWVTDWTRAAGMDVLGDRLAAQHDGEAPILVMVDPNGSAFGDTECVGASETYLTRDVPAFVVSHFGAAPSRDAWAVAGYSEGGTCAVTLALRHPDRYGAFADLAGDARPDVGGHRHTVQKLFSGSEVAYRAHDPETLLADGPVRGVAALFAAGRDDGAPRRATMLLADRARAAGLPVEAWQLPGGHDFGFVRRAMAQALPWLAQRLHP